MYIKVSSLAELNSFNEIWMECWLEKGYMLDLVTDDFDRFTILDDNKNKVGTIEFKPYSTEHSHPLNEAFPFHHFQHLKENPERVVEIDKVAIVKQHRGKNLEKLLTLFVTYCETNQYEYGIALLEKVFYKALKNVYKMPLQVVGEPFYYKGDHVTPIIVDTKLLYTEKENYSWIRREINV